MQSAPDAVVIAPASGDETTVLVSEVELAFALGVRRLARVAAVAPLLLLDQEVDGHLCPLYSGTTRFRRFARRRAVPPRRLQCLVAGQGGDLFQANTGADQILAEGVA